MIKITHLKKKLIKDAAIVLGVLVVTGGIMGWSIIYSSGLKSERDQLRQQSQVEISDAQKQQQEYESTIAAFDRYEKIPEHRRPANDYDTIQARIRAVRPVIEVLEQRYKFSRLDVKISKLDDPIPAEGGQPYTIIKSDLAIQFDGLTDEFVYSFIQSLINDLPGYLYLQDFTITKQEDITPEMLRQASASGTALPLVQGSMTLVWKTIKPAAAPAATPQG